MGAGNGCNQRTLPSIPGSLWTLEKVWLLSLAMNSSPVKFGWPWTKQGHYPCTTWDPGRGSVTKVTYVNQPYFSGCSNFAPVILVHLCRPLHCQYGQQFYTQELSITGTVKVISKDPSWHMADICPLSFLLWTFIDSSVNMHTQACVDVSMHASTGFSINHTELLCSKGKMDTFSSDYTANVHYINMIFL